MTIHRYGDPGAVPVVLVHGRTDAGTAWPDLVRHWGARWDVHAPDLRGHGSSPRFTDDELVAAPDVRLADVLALLDALPEPAALVGHSLGGLPAMRAALERPDDGLGAFLLGGTAAGRQDGGPTAETAPSDLDRSGSRRVPSGRQVCRAA